ncbi:HPr kinase/phosphorylase [bacterium BMS3Abin01]|nr:HPr kinase/phosphorylase [bacterium BMS3Abin01]
MTAGCGTDTVSRLIRLGKKLSAELSTSVYDVHGVLTRVTTNSGDIADALAHFLRAFAVDATGASRDETPDIDIHLFAVETLEDSMSPAPEQAELLYNWGMLKIRHDGSCRYSRLDERAQVTADVEGCQAAGFTEMSLLESDWLVTNLFFYPLWAQLLKVKGLFPLHAAGLVREGRSILFLGRSGSGKSTLSISLVRSGFGLLSDDTVFLREKDDRVEALSFPEEINVREETIKLLPELSRVKNFTVNELRQKSSFSIEELYPGSIVHSSTPVVMAFPRIADRESTTSEPMSSTDALSQSLRYGFFFLDPSTTERHFYIMSLLARQTRCFHFNTGSEQDGLVRAVNQLMAGPEQDGVPSEEGK